MSDKITLKPIAAALGTTFAVTLAASPLANAADNPFGLTNLGSGYMVAEEGKCGGEMEGGEAAGGEKESGEGACGGEKESGEAAGGEKSDEEGKCGEAKCGA
jgi:uncharacterized low-complexity protein